MISTAVAPKRAEGFSMSLLGVIRDAMDRRRTMREIQTFETNDGQDRYWTFKNNMIEAIELLDRGYVVQAKEICNRALEMFPEQALKSQQTLGLLLKLRLFDELERILTRGLKRYPSDPHLLASSALSAYESGNLEEALRRCETLRKKHPRNDKGYWIAAAAMSQLNRFTEAETIFVRALRILPADAGLLIEYAKLAERAKHWTVALERWNKLFEVCKHLAGISGAAVALAHLRRFDEADALIATIKYRAGTDHLVWFSSARVAELKADWEEAARRWTIYRDRFPLLLAGYAEALRPLRELNCNVDVEMVLRDGIERFPFESKLLTEYALIAELRHEWEEAATRWATVRERFPKNLEGYARGAAALEELGRVDEAREVRLHKPD